MWLWRWRMPLVPGVGALWCARSGQSRRLVLLVQRGTWSYFRSLQLSSARSGRPLSSSLCPLGRLRCSLVSRSKQISVDLPVMIQFDVPVTFFFRHKAVSVTFAEMLSAGRSAVFWMTRTFSLSVCSIRSTPPVEPSTTCASPDSLFWTRSINYSSK